MRASFPSLRPLSLSETAHRHRPGPGIVALAVSSAAAALTAAAVGATAAAVARRVVTPDHGQPDDDVQILGVSEQSVTLVANDLTVAAGRYGMWFDGVRGHARLGEVLDHDVHAGTVTRELLGVDAGVIRAGSGRWNQYFYAGTPSRALGLDYEDVAIVSPAGHLPAWRVDPSEGVRARRTWVVLVHGRGASREEALRALPVLHRLGFTSLVISYRNDAEALAVPRGRYHLGANEWEDVEAAVVYALESGANDVMIMAWSMGAAITMQLLDRSWVSTNVRSVVLDAPVLDWRSVLDHHARLNRLPLSLARLSQWMLSSPHGRHLASLQMPVDLQAMNWVERADELTVPMLIVHSSDDDFVPADPSIALAAARPDLVQLVSGIPAGHTKEWNVDHVAWETSVARFLLTY